MNIPRTISVALATMGLASFLGCVNPESMTPTVVSKYQEELARQGAPVRADNPGTGSLLQPPVNSQIPPLKIVKDDKGTHVYLSLDETIVRALANNVDIRVVSYDPEISREEMVKAAAEFDYVLAGAYNHENDWKQVNSRFGGGQVDERSYSIGVKQKTITGMSQSLSWTMTRSWDNSQLTRIFQTAWENQLVWQATQPLLRDAWPDFNLSKLKITQVNYKASVAAFRQKTEETMTDVIASYWNLMQTRRDLQIQQDLLDKTIITYDRVLKRADLDATEVQIKQTEAAVASRKAVLITAQKAIMDAQDRLVRLMADSQLTLLGDFEVIPTTDPVTALVEYNVTDQVLTGLAHNPVLEQARWAIDASLINVRIAENQELPIVNLVGSAGIQGLNNTIHLADETMWGGKFFSYSFGVQAEYPIGNRARRADTAEKRFQYQKSIAQMQTTADQVAALIKERIRQVGASYAQIQAQMLVVDASKAQLRALEETEKTRGRLNPEFLQLKLQAQESVAEAERQYVLAVSSYNATMVDLSRATGTVLEIHNIKIALPALIEEKAFPRPSGEATSASSPYWPPPTTVPGPTTGPAQTPEGEVIPGTPATPASNGTTGPALPPADGGQ